jgi:hypothetical protein
MITQNLVRNLSTLLQYTKLIKQVWDDHSSLSKGEQGQTLQEFIMHTAAIDPLALFLNNWDKDGYIYSNEDMKVWWAVQKLSGMHCIQYRPFPFHCLTFDILDQVSF